MDTTATHGGEPASWPSVLTRRGRNDIRSAPSSNIISATSDQERNHHGLLFSKDIQTKDGVFVHMRDIYDAEQQIAKAFCEMIEQATEPQLKQGFEAHLDETKSHIKRMEQVVKMHGAKARGVDCPAIDGISISGGQGDFWPRNGRSGRI
ncbi:MAG: DUF892 family protein [Rhizobiales bacterium]|nr:DUF892 family protein [Hyphomicrobiales bacterium]